MAQLPRISDHETVMVFESLGWSPVRQIGNHMILVREDHPATLSVPNHKEVAKGTLRSLIRSAGIPVDGFVNAMA